MIFLGDLSIPNQHCSDLLIRDMKRIELFRDETIVVNLEGVLSPCDSTDSFWKVYNFRSAIEIKDVSRSVVCSLANNHTYDYPENIDYTLQQLNENGIAWFGLRNNTNVVAPPYCFEENGVQYAIFGHCWSVYTHTNKNRTTHHHVEDCSYEEYYKVVTRYIAEHRNVKVVCFLHWNFDMEEFPFPAYKQLAHELIDFGAEAVIGNHAHVIQEAEIYRGKIIAYGLGNFYMPDGYFFNGNLKYPPKSHQCLGVQIFGDGRTPVVHRFATDVSNECALKYISTDDVHDEGTAIYSFSKHKQYISFFSKNRIKKLLVPVFKTYDSTVLNHLKTTFLVLRIRAIRFAKKIIDRIRGF